MAPRKERLFAKGDQFEAESVAKSGSQIDRRSFQEKKALTGRATDGFQVLRLV
jgi:hypothetical protein